MYYIIRYISNSNVTAYGSISYKGAGVGAGGRMDEDDLADRDHGTIEFTGDLTPIVRVGDSRYAALNKVDTNEFLQKHDYGAAQIAFECRVTYDANDATYGTAPTDETVYERNQKATVQDNTGGLERTLHTFKGWNTKPDGSGTNYQPGDKMTVNGSITLYAEWERVAAIPYMDHGLQEQICTEFEEVTHKTEAFQQRPGHSLPGQGGREG